MSPFSPQSTSITPLESPLRSTQYRVPYHRQVRPSQSLPGARPHRNRRRPRCDRLFLCLLPHLPKYLPCLRRPPSKTTTIKLLDLPSLSSDRDPRQASITTPSQATTTPARCHLDTFLFVSRRLHRSPLPYTHKHIHPLRLNLVVCPSTSSLDDPHSYLSPAASIQPWLALLLDHLPCRPQKGNPNNRTKATEVEEAKPSHLSAPRLDESPGAQPPARPALRLAVRLLNVPNSGATPQNTTTDVRARTRQRALELRALASSPASTSRAPFLWIIRGSLLWKLPTYPAHQAIL